MHYRNGREARNGDQIVIFTGAPTYGGERVLRTGILHNAQAGNDYCNGTFLPLDGGPVAGACLVDALHFDDAIAMLGGWDRPAGR